MMPFTTTTLRVRSTSMVALGLLLAASSWAGTLTNGGFEAPSVTAGTYQIFSAGSVAIPGWTVTGPGGATVTVASNTFSCCGVVFNSSEGIQLLDLTGVNDDGTAAGVIQTVTLTAGAYDVSFDVGRACNCDGREQDGIVDLLINGIDQGTFTNSDITAGAVNWKTFTVNFAVGAGDTTIEFRNATGGIFNGLDNVVLDQTSTTPEPSSIVLLGGALLALVAARRRN
jgi:hypothetical protein